MAFDPRQYAYKRLVDSGVHPYYAAAAVGNFDHETGSFKYPKSLVPGENSAGFPHFNAGAGRLQPFEKYMRSRGVEDYLDPQTNMDYIINEDLPKNYPQLWNRMKTQPHSVESANIDFMNTYESPAKATAGVGSRLRRAQTILELMQRNPAPQQVTERVNIPAGQMANPSQQVATGPAMSQQFPNIWKILTEGKQGQAAGGVDVGEVQKEAGQNKSPMPNSPNEPMPKPAAEKPPGYGSMGMARAGMAGLEVPDSYTDMSQAAMPLLFQLIKLSQSFGGNNG